MSSAVRAFKAATGRRSSDDEAAAQEAEKYRLIVTAGSSYDKSTHKVVGVNTGEAVSFENEFVRAKVQVQDRRGRRVRGPWVWVVGSGWTPPATCFIQVVSTPCLLSGRASQDPHNTFYFTKHYEQGNICVTRLYEHGDSWMISVFLLLG